MEINLPAKLNLYEVVTIPPFENTQECKDTLNAIKAKKRNRTTRNLILWGIFLFVVVTVFSSGHPFIGVAIVIVGGGLLLGIAGGSRFYDDTLQKAKGEHCRKIIQELVNSNFPGSVYFYHEDKGLIYNNDVFAYVSMKDGKLVICNVSNINNVSVKAVTTNKFGSVFRVDSYGTVTIRQGYLEEYQMEITTNFIENPIISINVARNRYFYTELKKAAAIFGVSFDDPEANTLM